MSVNVQATFCATVVDEWVHLGVTDAVVCPGSRSTPLAVALAGRLTVHVRLDERSAAFFALGLSMATDRPTVICTTSGTAAAELHPAVLEAHHGLVPLLVCTADRPPELQQVGASQTVDQVALFASATSAGTRWASAPGVPDEGQRATWRPWAARAHAEATSGPHGPGPVHLNLAFRESLVGEPGPLPPRRGPQVFSAPPDYPVSESFESFAGTGIFIAGAGATSRPEQLMTLAHMLGWPVLADPRSGCRLPGTIAAADAIVRTNPTPPDCIVLLGAPWLSKALAAYVRAAADGGTRVLAVDPWWQWTDPDRVVSERHHANPDTFIDVAMDFAERNGDGGWISEWHALEEQAQVAIHDALGSTLSEPAVARAVAAQAAATGAVVVVSASMPMRDLEWFSPTFETPPRVLANRGANGIDGVVSTALGVAASGQRTICLLGDLAFLHDVSGLVNLPELPCTFVVLDNGGGGIFSFLPQAESLDPGTFEQLFGTPPTSDVAAVAGGFGLDVVAVTTVADLESALGEAGTRSSASLIRVMVPTRAENAALHDRINQAVRDALT